MTATITFLRDNDRRPQIIVGNEALENAITYSRKLRLYVHEGRLVRLEKGQPVKATAAWLRQKLPTVMGFVNIKQGKLVAANVPPGLAQYILSASGQYPTLRVLSADKAEAK